MSIKLRAPEVTELQPRITVFGVGGAGGNAVANMIRSELQGVEFVVANTDAQALAQSPSERRIQLGVSVTQGLGAGSRPEIGAAAAEESLEEILEHLTGAHMAFITAGMGGGTGTGAAPVIARAAREHGLLTVGVVTKPFHFEGARRMRVAESGIADLQQYVDTLIIIPNQNLFRIANEKTTFAQAFAMADEVLHSGVRGITDLMVMPGLINLDFADIRTVMNEMGKAMMGTGEAEGENRALEAAEAAISNPLLDEVSMKGAQGVLIHITGGMDLTLFEVDEAANRIRSEVDPDANIIVGSTFNEPLEGKMRVSVVATGIDAEDMVRPKQPMLPSHAPRPQARTIQPLASAGSVVAAPANPVNQSIRELAARVQTEMELDADAAESARAEERETEPEAARPIAASKPAPIAAAEREAASDMAADFPAAPAPLATSVTSSTLGEPARSVGTQAAARYASQAAPAGAGRASTDGLVLGRAERPGTTRSRRPSASQPTAEAREGEPEPAAAKRTKKRASNFFERMTSGRGLLGGGHQQAPASPPATPAKDTSAPRGKPLAERSAPTIPTKDDGSGGSASGDRLFGTALDEEPLEIPAFLRRQAN